MKKVIVLAVLFLSALSTNYAQAYAGIDTPYVSSNEAISSNDKNGISPKKTDTPIFINGSDFQSELTGLSLLPTPAREQVQLLIESTTDKIYKVALFNQVGTELHAFEITANTAKPLTVEQYPAGSYYFLIYIPDGSIKKKFEIVD